MFCGCIYYILKGRKGLLCSVASFTLNLSHTLPQIVQGFMEIISLKPVWIYEMIILLESIHFTKENNSFNITMLPIKFSGSPWVATI